MIVTELSFIQRFFNANYICCYFHRFSKDSHKNSWRKPHRVPYKYSEFSFRLFFSNHSNSQKQPPKFHQEIFHRFFKYVFNSGNFSRTFSSHLQNLFFFLISRLFRPRIVPQHYTQGLLQQILSKISQAFFPFFNEIFRVYSNNYPK